MSKWASSTNYDRENVIAKILQGTQASLRIYEDEATIAIMDIKPQSEGHALVIPKAPSRNILHIERQDLISVIQTTQRIARAAMVAFSANGVTIIQCNEAEAGQTVFHTHFHVLPRRIGVPLKPHAREEASQCVLVLQAQAYRRALSSDSSINQ